MTNSRLTDPEVLEFRFPVRLVAHIGQAEMRPGDVFEIHTPGGGYGVPVGEA